MVRRKRPAKKASAATDPLKDPRLPQPVFLPNDEAEELVRSQEPLGRPGDRYNSPAWLANLSDDVLCYYLNAQQGLVQEYAAFAKDILSDPHSLYLLSTWDLWGHDGRKQLALAIFSKNNTYNRSLAPEVTLDWMTSGRGLEILLNSAFDNGLRALDGDENWRPLGSDAFDKYNRIPRGSGESATRPPRAFYFTNKLMEIQRHNILLHLTIAFALASTATMSGPNFDLSHQPHLYPVEKPFFKPKTRHQSTRMHNRAPSRHSERGVGFEDEEWAAKGWDAIQRGGPECCDACGRERDQVEELVKEKKGFSHCSKCITLDRRHPYCSRDCQVRHYQRHKRICGKTLADVIPTPTFPPLPPVHHAPFAARWQYERHRTSPFAMYTIFTKPPQIGSSLSDHFTITLLEGDDGLFEDSWSEYRREFAALLADAADAAAKGKAISSENPHLVFVLAACWSEIETSTSTLGRQERDLRRAGFVAQICRDFRIAEEEMKSILMMLAMTSVMNGQNP
ncbi:hypothetical protein JCM8097_008057 [Rhodosporidiobolus ruineniae]